MAKKNHILNLECKNDRKTAFGGSEQLQCFAGDKTNTISLSTAVSTLHMTPSEREMDEMDVTITLNKDMATNLRNYINEQFNLD